MNSPRRLLPVLFFFLLFTLLAVFDFLELVNYVDRGGIQASYWRLATAAGVRHYSLGLLTWIIFRLYVIFPFRRGGLRAAFGFHALFLLVFCQLDWWRRIGAEALGPAPAGDARPLLFPLSALWSGLPTYGLILIAAWAVDFYRRSRRQELQAARLREQLSEARLSALKTQLQPHFLFNSLNTVSALMERDVPAARRVLARLGDLLRRTLDSSEQQEISLQQELDFLGAYLDIERIRFEDRLKLEHDIAPDTVRLSVPALVLQPLVENSLRHGLGRSSKAGTVAIRSRIAEGRLVLEVEDDGPGAGPGWRPGVGLSNIQARLRHLYGPAAGIEFENRLGRGFRVRLVLPLKEEAAA